MLKKRHLGAPAQPKYHIGAKVNYRDHRGKEVRGTIVSATANWFGYHDGEAFTLTYALTHPTSSRHEHHGDDDIIGEVTERK